MVGSTPARITSGYASEVLVIETHNR